MSGKVHTKSHHWWESKRESCDKQKKNGVGTSGGEDGSGSNSSGGSDKDQKASGIKQVLKQGKEAFGSLLETKPSSSSEANTDLIANVASRFAYICAALCI